MPESIFDQIKLFDSTPRYSTLGELLRLKGEPGHRLRQVIDSWVADDSAAARAKFTVDLISPQTSVGTFSELVLREILKRKFGALEREPKGLPVGGKNPDFGVRNRLR